MANQQDVQPEQQFVFTLTLRDKRGILVSVMQIFDRNGVNISSLCVEPSGLTPESQMVVRVGGRQRTMNQIIKQLAELVDVIEVSVG